MPDPLLAALREHARYKDSFELRVGDGWLPLVRACHEAVVAEFRERSTSVVFHHALAFLGPDR